MIPKSTAKLSEGDFCWIKRNDGLFVPFIFICKQGNARSYFYGGIVNCLCESPDINKIPSKVYIYEYALLHIKCFKENQTPIVGNIHNKLQEKYLKKIHANINDFSIGATSNVWGYKVIYSYAEKIKPKT